MRHSHGLSRVTLFGLALAALAACVTPASTTPRPPAPDAPAARSPAPAAAPAAPAADGGDGAVTRTATPMANQPEDPHLWLEEVTGKDALTWVRQQNAKSTKELEGDPRFTPLRARLVAILDSKEKVPWVQKRGRHLYNFWRDEDHTRGLWRRVASMAEYQKAKPNWEPVLDLDALAAAEKENWVWGGVICLYPDGERCLVQLSRGGGDSHVLREFDTVKKAFVGGGFNLPEAKSEVAWKDRDTLYVGTDFGPGALTDSGYPRLAKEWRRGAPLSEAALIKEGKPTDVAVRAYRVWDHGTARDFVERAVSRYENEYWLRDGPRLTALAVPLSSNIATWDDQLLVQLRDDWTIGGRTWAKGALLATGLTGFLEGKRDFTQLFTPAPNSALVGQTNLKTALVLTELEDVRNKVYAWTRKAGAWSRNAVDVGGHASVALEAVDDAGESDEAWFTATDFTVPSTLSLLTLGAPSRKLKQSPAFFDARGLVVEQHFATSKDGTKVPYFQVAKKNLQLDGENPTLLTGYGGFEISLEAAYSGLVGAGWLERGGVYVQANIRGGGEYGPSWHQAALKTKRQRAYDDFAAIAQDLSARKVTKPKRLGIVGGSNGGLLVGVMLTQRPELFGAVICEAPLLDMRRFSTLLAGASWVAEYGDPAVPDEWAALARYSPYHNARRHATYPRALFTASTRDDRVHPGHARKMVARLTGWGHDVLYYENVEGGHSGSANNGQLAFMEALTYTFLARQLGLGDRK